jgi:membrane associated rhomboid family serine protease
MLPLSDGLHPRRFPIVNVALIAANFAVWILYVLPHLNSAVYHASFYPCIPAWVYLGGWFLYELVEGNFGLASASANGGGGAFFAHVGGFVFGAIVTRALLNAGRVAPQSTPRRPALAPF